MGEGAACLHGNTAERRRQRRGGGPPRRGTPPSPPRGIQLQAPRRRQSRGMRGDRVPSQRPAAPHSLPSTRGPGLAGGSLGTTGAPESCRGSWAEKRPPLSPRRDPKSLAAQGSGRTSSPGPWAGVPASATRCHRDLVPQKALAALRDPCPALLPAQRHPAHSSGRRSRASCPKPAPDRRRPGEHPCGSTPARC